MIRPLIILCLLLAGTAARAAEVTIDRSLLVLDSAAADIFVPAGAVVQRDGIPGVYVMRAGEARFRMVRPGKVRDGRVQILSGLFGDETLLLGDMAVLYDGSPVEPKGAGSMASNE